MHETVKREKIDKRWKNLWLPTTVDWSYRANRFDLGSRSDPASWLEEPYSVLWLAVITDRCVVIGCLLIDLVILIDSYRSMIVTFASPVTRGFLSLLDFPSLSRLFAAKGNLWDQGTMKVLGPNKNRVLKWWCYKNDFSRIVDFYWLFGRMYVFQTNSKRLMLVRIFRINPLRDIMASSKCLERYLENCCFKASMPITTTTTTTFLFTCF